MVLSTTTTPPASPSRPRARFPRNQTQKQTRLAAGAGGGGGARPGSAPAPLPLRSSWGISRCLKERLFPVLVCYPALELGLLCFARLELLFGARLRLPRTAAVNG